MSGVSTVRDSVTMISAVDLRSCATSRGEPRSNFPVYTRTVVSTFTSGRNLVVIRACAYLGCYVIRCPTGSVQELECLVVTSTVKVGQAKIRNFDVAGAVEKDVLRFQVAMAHSL